MGLKEKLLGKTVFIDTAPLIYFIEGHSEYQVELLESKRPGRNTLYNIYTDPFGSFGSTYEIKTIRPG